MATKSNDQSTAIKKSAKSQFRVKEPVRLRFRKLQNGNTSVFLDIATASGRAYEFLKLYLVPERSDSDKQANAHTLSLANAIKAKRIVELQNNAHGFSNKASRSNADLLAYLQREVVRYQEKGSVAYARSILNSINHLKTYKGERIPFKQVDKSFMLGYIDYLKRATARGDKPLSSASQSLYYTVLVIALNRAVKDDVLDTNPAHGIASEDTPKQPESTRAYLTLDEVSCLSKTVCGIDVVGRAFLFSCFTGLRLSDIRALSWGQIKENSRGRKQIEMKQKKTGEPIYLPLNDNALSYLPEKGKAKAGDLVFALPHVSCVEKYLARWATDAGIEKRVTYHVSRHTNAVLLLEYGADIYTVSKLLGHTSVKTTQIYAEIADAKKREAVDLIPALNL